MSNPYLPSWEYIPDGEPRVFGDRVYIYGSHDRADSEDFCDYKLKVWSAPVDDLNNWTCHGDIFRTRPDSEHPADVDWTDNLLFAPDVARKDGKYYLYAYIVGAKGCVAVSDRPEGPFKLIGQYEYNIPKHYDNGTFIDPGVLVDDDGRVYVYCGYLGSYMCELDGNDMHTVIDGTYMENIIPTDAPFEFFEACSPRKIGNTYYLIYSPKRGSRLAYATADSPRGPFTYRGYFVDNGVDYPGGNDHGSVCNIKGQWYIFYHRMTNGSIMQRRGCVEKIYINEDGSFDPVEMTSLGFEEKLNPYKVTEADTACVLLGPTLAKYKYGLKDPGENAAENADAAENTDAAAKEDSGDAPAPEVTSEVNKGESVSDKEFPVITEIDPFTRVITNLTHNCVMGWKYYDFGEDYTDGCMRLMMRVIPRGCSGVLRIYADDVKPENEIGVLDFDRSSAILSSKVKKLTGRHSIYIKAEQKYTSWAKGYFEKRPMVDIEKFVFMK